LTDSDICWAIQTAIRRWAYRPSIYQRPIAHWGGGGLCSSCMLIVRPDYLAFTLPYTPLPPCLRRKLLLPEARLLRTSSALG